jgi:outer membrane protein W
MSKQLCVFLTLALAATALPAAAQGRGWYGADQNFRLRLGGFQPAGDSEYWRDKEVDFTGEASDLTNVSFGIDYRVDLAPQLGLQFSGTTFEGEMDQEYRDFVDDSGFEIRHTTRLELASVTAGVVLFLTEPGAAVRPYLGAGAGAWFWRLEEDGEFIDFTPPPPVIFDATLESEGTAFGYYGQAGFEVPVGRQWSFFAEGRWQQVEDDLADDFADDFGKIDLSGLDVGAGVSWRF